MAIDPPDVNATTRRVVSAGHEVNAAPQLALTILFHTDATRIGERAWIAQCQDGGEQRVSRLEPSFAVAKTTTGPLADPFISRRPFTLRGRPDGLQVAPALDGTPVILEGELLRAPRHVSSYELDRGVVLQLGERALLFLHRVVERDIARPAPLNLIGISAAIDRVRGEIADAAASDVPVLARGETGSGKEMIAEALHKASERASGPFVAVSLAALVATTAASELFGHRRGAFTGAHADHDGHFVRANGGTLFLDEVGEASLELQAMLLRVLETREVLPVGGARAERVDVRLISATDADLEHACSEGSFREALYHRLAGCQIRIPPLRERREDITLLFVHFLRSELSALGAEARLDPAMTAERPWLAASIVARLVRYAWPGNVRQVRNVARQIALANRQLEQVELPHAVRETLDAGRVAAAASALVPATRKAPSEITEDELVAALRANSWSPGATAAQLGIARNSLYALIDRATTVRKARDVDRDELARSYEACGGDVDAMAVQLEISARALKLRLRELGLDKP